MVWIDTVNSAQTVAVNITKVTSGKICGHAEGVIHNKALPCLSVVQAIHGNYDIALNGGQTMNTGEMGVFIAPSGVQQTIGHHDGKDGVMHAHWAFINATVNGRNELDFSFHFPTLLPAQHNERVFELLNKIAQEESYCLRYAATYCLLDILMQYAIQQPEEDEAMSAIRAFVQANFTKKIQANEIAEAIHCSSAQVFRYVKRYFGLSPANYVNLVRLQNAALALECSNAPVTEIAYDVGFNDLPYFSNLFRRKFGRSPQQYRLNVQRVKDN